MSGYGRDGATTLADLNPSPEELAELADVLGEVEADGWDDADPGYYGELDPETGLPPELANTYGQGSYDVLSAVSDSIELANQRAAAAAELSAVPLPRRSEDRMAQLLDRAAAGMYDLSTPDGSTHGCGPLDEFGRCSSPFHAGECFETFRGEPIGSTPEAMDAWRDTLLSNGRAAVELANANTELAMQADETLAGPNDLATYHAMRQLLGIGGR